MDLSAGDLKAPYASVDRRRTPRIEIPFPAIARGVEANGRRFEEHIVLDNLSGLGLYLRLMRPVAQGARLFVYIRLSNAPDPNAHAAYVAAHGLVARVEPQLDGAFGIAVIFTYHRFVYDVMP